ncbi:MAG: glycosyltransferase family 2 protein [Hydrogenophaga sp.]|nr:glycosyltransferase family 2 protein [Hydrogenophaga sp.]
MKTRVAVLLTCHNRKNKTLSCLETLHLAAIHIEIDFQVYLVDDGCTDGTVESVSNTFPSVKIIQGNGKLYWAGGMRLAWNTALKEQNYDAFILLNDDVKLHAEFIENFITCDEYSRTTYGSAGVYSAATEDPVDQKITYGGSKILGHRFRVKSKPVVPENSPQLIDIANANILWVDQCVVKAIGILDCRFTHGIADYDFALRARKSGFPVLLANKAGGLCINDHGKNFLSHYETLARRIRYLKSPTGLAYSDYLFYVRRHFPSTLPYAFSMLWLKTLAPRLWDIFK